jgi:hypothetical protein
MTSYFAQAPRHGAGHRRAARRRGGHRRSPARRSLRRRPVMPGHRGDPCSQCQRRAGPRGRIRRSAVGRHQRHSRPAHRPPGPFRRLLPPKAALSSGERPSPSTCRRYRNPLRVTRLARSAGTGPRPGPCGTGAAIAVVLRFVEADPVRQLAVTCQGIPDRLRRSHRVGRAQKLHLSRPVPHRVTDHRDPAALSRRTRRPCTVQRAAQKLLGGFPVPGLR